MKGCLYKSKNLIATMDKNNEKIFRAGGEVGMEILCDFFQNVLSMVVGL